MSYVLTQTDGNETLMEVTTFEDIPTLNQFSNIAYYVDKDEVEDVYEEVVFSIGEWVYARAVNEDGDCCEYYVDDGVYFLLEKVTTDEN